MPRPSVLLMCAGTAAVLVALVALWTATRGDSSAAAPTEHAPAPTPTEPETATPASHTPAATEARSAHTPTTTTSTSGPAPALRSDDVRAANAPAEDLSARPQDSNENLQYGVQQLRAQAKAVEPLVRECVDKAVAAGAHPTGTVALTHIVAYHGDKLVVEDTGIDSEKTTVQQDSLLECLHQTAKAMTFAGLPRRAKALYVTRQLTLEDGKITEYKHASFSYLR